jgi:phenylalanyl-tRNA synthetase alpha chain
MEYKNTDIAKAAKVLLEKFEKLDDKRSILRAPELIGLYDQIKLLPSGKDRAKFGKEVNYLKSELEELVKQFSFTQGFNLSSIDVTAPFDINIAPESRPNLLSVEQGSKHPLTVELDLVLDIFSRMGFSAIESREIDDDYHMFTSLNFPPDHPARDDYDTFMTDEGLIAPAHTSTMQNRVLKTYKKDLDAGNGIRVVIPGRVFRNEDLDARHEHTFYQLEGVYVDEGINAGHLVATIKTWLSNYFGKEVKIKTQPFYFPFTEPSFEFSASCPFCDEKGCSICSYSGWIELGGCGMIHPNVFSIERLVMLKYNIEDIRHFESANLKFLRQFP